MKKFVWLSFFYFLVNALGAQPLQHHTWKDRVVLLLAPDAQEGSFKEQYGLWTAQPGEVTARNLVLYQVFKKEGTGPDGKALQPEQLRQLIDKYGPVPAKGSKLVLIGKDGTVKMEQQAVLHMADLFARIDRMPMRRAEMRQQKN